MKIPTLTHKKLTFLNVNQPTTAQLKFLHEAFGFSMLNLEDYLYKTQIPKLEFYNDYSLFVLDIPSIQQPQVPKTSILPKNMRRRRIGIGEVDFFIGKDYLVVIHDDRTPQIDQFFELCSNDESKRKEFMEKGPAFLFYCIADNLVDTSFSYVTELTNTIDSIDRQLEEKSSVAVIEDVSVTRRNIVVFETMIKPTLPIFTDLERGKYPELGGEMLQYWSNILDHLQKIWDRLEDNKELIEGISRSHESLLTVRTNEIIKVLTMFTAIMLPLTFLASIYGMNINLPFAHTAGAFFGLLGVMTSLAILMVLFFRSRDWL